MSFKNAFNTARKQGKGVFTWNGKKYNTMQKEDTTDDFRQKHSDYDYFLGNLANDTGGWKVQNPVQTSYIVNKVPEPIKQEISHQNKPQNTAQPQQNNQLQMFTNNDIKSLGFRNYNGLVNAVNNQTNSNNNFIKALTTRYGNDTSKWNQQNIEKDLGVKGTYRSFGSGDFGDMSRSMASWMGTYNGNLAKQEQDKIWNQNAGVKYSLTDTSVSANKYQLQKPQLNIPSYTSNNLVNLKFKNGGIMYKYQQGGQAPQQDMQQQAIALVQAAMQGDQQANQTIKQIMQAAQQGDQQALQVAQLLQQIIKQMQNSRKARLGAKLEYFKCGGKKSTKKLEQGDPISEFKKGCKVKKAVCGKKITKHQQGGWIDKKKGIWNWDSTDRMNRVAKYYRGEVDDISDDDWLYVKNNPQLGSFLHNVYKNSKLPNKRISVSMALAKNTNNMPKGADPNAKVDVVPDSTNNYKGLIGIGHYKMLPRQPQQSTNKNINYNKANQRQKANNTKYMYGATNSFENMAAQTRNNGNWHKDIQTWKDPKTGKSYQYITRDGINYLSNGRYWNPKTKIGGNYTWKPGWRIFGGGFQLH